MNAFWLAGFSARQAHRERHGIAGEAMPYIAVCLLATLSTKVAVPR